MNWHPLRFTPIYKERVWGGRRLQEMYGRPLPDHVPIGESWEISDRPEAVSIVAEGPLAGRTLTELVEADPAGLLGDVPPRQGRFPLLVKILDAREMLSLQVHPPPERALQLGGEPKTEMWYFTAADPGAEILVGLKRGTTREEFERRLAEGTVADCIHRSPVRAGDAMHLPSGRVHALGAGLLLFEIQESSDTTYRVFDWNRPGLDGKPRPLHVRESLDSIRFDDHEPPLLPTAWHRDGITSLRPLVANGLFDVEVRRGPRGAGWERPTPRCTIVGVIRGSVTVGTGLNGIRLGPGDFCMLPAGMADARIHIEEDAEWLAARPGPGRH